MTGKYDDHDWSELPDDAKAAAKVLGFNKKMWNGDREPASCDENWTDLTKEQQEAAAVLGYDEKSWNDDGACACCIIS